MLDVTDLWVQLFEEILNVNTICHTQQPIKTFSAASETLSGITLSPSFKIPPVRPCIPWTHDTLQDRKVPKENISACTYVMEMHVKIACLDMQNISSENIIL